MANRTTAFARLRVMRLLMASVGLIAVLSPAAKARAEVALQRKTLELRVEAVRQALPAIVADEPRAVDQWGNWGNWNNWNNWPNFGNWGNWNNWNNV